MQKQYKDESRKQRPRPVMPGRVPTALDLARAAKEAMCDDDPKIKSGIEAVFYTGNQFVAQCLWQEIERRRIELELSGDAFYPPPEPEKARGDLVVGVIVNAMCLFGLLLEELCEHVLIIGRSGAGKTTLVRVLIRQLLSILVDGALAVRILVFDIKGEFTSLKNNFPDVWVLAPGTPSLRWNPLEPMTQDEGQWAKILSESWTDSMGFVQGQGTSTFILKCLLAIYSKYDVRRGVYPSLLDLLAFLDWLKQSKIITTRSEEYTWFMRFYSRVESLCKALGETVYCSKGFPIGELLRHHVVFDLTYLGASQQAFFVETFLLQCIWYRRRHGETGGVTRNVAFFDEGKRIWPISREKSHRGTSNIADTVAMVRDVGIGLVISDCNPSLLANTVKSSCFAQFCFHQVRGEEVRESADSLGLSFEQRGEIQKLQRGQCLVRLGGRIAEPFKLMVKP